MPHIMVPFANGKGGVGKTALACSYAAARAREGADVLLADVNEQQRTAFSWSEARNHNRHLPKLRVEVMPAWQAMEQAGRCEVLVIDAPGWTDRSTLALARRSTFMVIPTGPNPTYELAPTVRLLHGLKAEGVEAWRMGVVLSRFSEDETIRGQEEDLARAYLKEAGYVALDGCLRNSAVYGSALAEGLGLTEIEGEAGLQKEASFLMASIEKSVQGADRRHAKIAEQAAGKTRDREGRGR